MMRMNPSSLKVAVSQRFLPHYRVAFYEWLVEKLDSSGITLRLFYGYPMGPVSSFRWSIRIGGIKFTLPLGELTETAVISPRVLFQLLQFRPDVVIVEDIAGLPNSVVAAIYCRILRKPYLIWGLGTIPAKRRSMLRYLLWPLIKFLYSGSSAFICYSKHAQEVYAVWGKPTFLAPNAALLSPTKSHVEKVTIQLRKKYRSSSKSIVAIGELKYQKRFDVLLVAFSRLRAKGVELHIIGDGPERHALARLADELAIIERVRFHGAIFDNEKKGEIISRCWVGVLPGRGGLVIQELMYWGTPVICGAADGTERDNVIHGRNGFLLSDAADPEEIARAIDDFFGLTDAQAMVMAREALMRTVTAYNVECMAKGVEEAIHDALSGSWPLGIGENHRQKM
jgi:glycosyltransferase involved in cell wall biosynthesis